jgi:hypothetical protein
MMDEPQKTSKDGPDKASELREATTIDISLRLNLEERIGQVRRQIEQEYTQAMATEDAKTFGRHTVRLCALTDRLVELVKMQASSSRAE